MNHGAKPTNTKCKITLGSNATYENKETIKLREKKHQNNSTIRNMVSYICIYIYIYIYNSVSALYFIRSGRFHNFLRTIISLTAKCQKLHDARPVTNTFVHSISVVGSLALRQVKNSLPYQYT